MNVYQVEPIWTDGMKVIEIVRRWLREASRRIRRHEG